MADLVTRLRLDNKEFDDNIRKSKQQLDTFKNIGSSVTSSIKSLGMQFAAAAGLMEGFSTVVNSNATLQREWTGVMGGAKEAVDDFFTSLSNGDWSKFQRGMGQAFTNGRNFTLAMKDAANALKYADINSNNADFLLNQYENRIIDENSSQADRDAAMKDFNNAYDVAINDLKVSESFVTRKLTEAMESVAGDMGDMNGRELKALVNKYFNPATTDYEMMQNYISDYSEGGTSRAGANAAYSKEQKMMAKLWQKYGKEGKEDELLEILDRWIGLQDKEQSRKKQWLDVNKEYKEKKGSSTGKSNPLIPEGTIEDLEKQIAAAKAQLKVTVDEPSRIRLYKEIKELEEQERVIKFRYENTEEPSKVSKRGGSLASMAKMPTMKIPSSNNNKLKKGANAANDYASALSNCATAIATFNSSKLENTGEGWTQWSSNLLAAAASTIIGLQSLTMAKGVNSAFDLPFPANIAAAAMVLSTVISLFSSIPAFASGGIFESPLTSGDRNLARLNGGEMILNKGQQYNLFKLLDNGTPINGNGGQVQFRISGKELVGVLSNYNNKVSKVR